MKQEVHSPAVMAAQWRRTERILNSRAAEDPRLEEDALCNQTDPEVFFPEKGGSTRDAKKVCGACAVRADCLEYALEHDEKFGVWGGLTEKERRGLKKKPQNTPHND